LAKNMRYNGALHWLQWVKCLIKSPISKPAKNDRRSFNPGMFNIFHAKNVKNHSTDRKIDSCRRPFIAQSSPNAKVKIGWYGKEFTHD